MCNGIAKYKLTYALNMMAKAKSIKHKNQRNFRITSRTYEQIKKEYIIAHKNRLNSRSDEEKQRFARSFSGKRHSAEWKLAMSKFQKSRYRSIESRRKISNSHLGKKLSEEHKQKLSISSTGRVHSDKTRKLISQSNKGRILSDETKNKMSLAKLGKVIVSTESRNKMSLAKLGFKQSEETIKKRSESLKKFYKNITLEKRTELGKKISAAKQGKIPSYRPKMSEETKAKMSAARKIYWELKRSTLDLQL